MSAYDRILIPLDGSDIASQAIPHALAMAQLGTATLILLQVVPDVGDVSMVMDDGAAPMRISREAAMERHLLDAAQEELENVAAGLRIHGLDVTVESCVGNPAHEIVEYAAANQVALIVMSTHGRTGVNRWIHGSVAAKVLEAASCPILIIPAHSI